MSQEHGLTLTESELEDIRQTVRELEGIKTIREHLCEAEKKAWESLSKYKFQMFGYWAAIWVHLNRIGNFKRPNPWKSLVISARINKTAASAIQSFEIANRKSPIGNPGSGLL